MSQYSGIYYKITTVLYRGDNNFPGKKIPKGIVTDKNIAEYINNKNYVCQLVKCVR